MTTPRKKLIEVSIPLEAINKASAREKSIRHGHPSTLHLWWARRPLAACRAVLFAQLVDDPSAWPEKFPTEVEQEKERLRLHRVIQEMVEWPESKPADQARFERAIEAARWEIARSVARGLGEQPPLEGDRQATLAYLQEKAPPVYDPFSGGGSIPLEAQRLGLRAYGSDLNPVAVLIGKAMVEVPPKFAGLPPVNPKSRAELERGRWNGKGAQGLAEDIRYYGQWMRDEAEKRIGHLYPKAKLKDGTEATVIAWFWARTVRSPDPAAKGAMVPLVSSFMLSNKDGKKAWMEPVIDATAADGWRVEVRHGFRSKEEEKRALLGTKTGRGEFACLLTGSVISDDYVREQTSAGNGSWRPLAVIAEGDKGKLYLAADAAPVPSVDPDLLSRRPQEEMFRGALGFRLQAYGIKDWGGFFRDRQVAALATFSNLVSEAQLQADSDAVPFGFENGEYGRAVATYLICALGRAVDYWTINTMWEPGGEFVIHTFSEMTVPIVWDSAEANPFAPGGGGWSKTCLDWVQRALEAFPNNVGSGEVVNLPAQEISPPANAVFSTDPPYFDNIGYADLSDAFFVWERHVLAGVWPTLSRRLSTPKENELVATPARHGGASASRDFFLDGMQAVFLRMFDSESSDPITIYYSFKEKGRIGEGSGWESFLEAIVRPGWQIDGSWPIRTERPTRNRSIGKAALASSIILVCRKRDGNAPRIDRAGFTAALRRDLPDAIAKIRAAGVGPVDMQQSVIGPGMGVFTRYAEVLDDDDRPLPVKAALTIINRVWQEIDSELVASFDAPTQVALAWFESYGFDARTAGELITLANAKSTSIDALFASEVFQNLHGKAALTPRESLSNRWSPARDKTLTVWECVQHTARVLNSADGGAAAAGRLVAEMGALSNDARALLDRLFQIATDKGWAQEALVYNQLAEEWPRLLEQAMTVSAAEPAERTGDLFA